jgi:hypothetical protein
MHEHVCTLGNMRVHCKIMYRFTLSLRSGCQPPPRMVASNIFFKDFFFLVKANWSHAPVGVRGDLSRERTVRRVVTMWL